jgi:hypothetical protein
MAMNQGLGGQGRQLKSGVDAGGQDGRPELRPDMRQAQARFLHALAADHEPIAGESLAARLRELGEAALWLGWTWRQGYEEGIRRPLPKLTVDDLPAALRPGTQRVSPPASWQRFDIAWRRLQARMTEGSVALAVFALVDFGQACQLTAAQVDPD